MTDMTNMICLFRSLLVVKYQAPSGKSEADINQQFLGSLTYSILWRMEAILGTVRSYNMKLDFIIDSCENFEFTTFSPVKSNRLRREG